MITVALIIKNGERRLKEVLASLSPFPEIILLDTGSEDKSLAIASEFPNVKIFKEEFKGFGEARNRAASHATFDWILAVDADEVVSKELLEEIFQLKLDSSKVYSIPFVNSFNGKWIKGCGWHPESHIRLYNRNVTSFSEDFVHEGILIKNLTVEKLRYPIHHIPYGSINEFLLKMDRYSTLFALQNRKKKRSSPAAALLHGAWAFFKSYFLQRGFCLGYEGFLIARYQRDVTFYKYLKLYHANLEK